MDVIFDEVMVRSEAWDLLGSVTLEMVMVSCEAVDWEAGLCRRSSSASRSMPWVARKAWAINGLSSTMPWDAFNCRLNGAWKVSL